MNHAARKSVIGVSLTIGDVGQPVCLFCIAGPFYVSS